MATISVFVRVRPMIETELRTHEQVQKRFIVAPSKKQISVQISDKRQKIFNFNRVFDQFTSQQQLFNGLELPSLITKVLDGYHSTIFAYGQTGSGKTYTIEGPQENPGLIARTLDQMFAQLDQRNNNQRVYKIMLSFVQIYNQGIYDLIDATGKPLKMRWNKHQQFIVEDLFEVQCRSKEDAFKWWKKGLKNKIMGSHKMNVSSSRSHCLFTLKVSSYDLQDPSNVIQSKFQIVDLAGSQRQKVTKSTGAMFRQGIQINKSLFTLRQVILALYQISQGQNPNKHIPYRDSKLTSLLKQSIGGNTYCSMIACLNPTATHFQESLQTLTYASMASFISNVPSKNVDPKVRENQQLREQNQQYRKQIKKMAEHIEQLTKMLQAGMCMSCKNAQGKPILRRTQTQTNPLKQQQQQNQPSGILKLPRFHSRTNTIQPQTPTQNTRQPLRIEVDKPTTPVPAPITTQKKTLKTNKDILQSITMIKQLINANSGLRQKIENLKSLSEKQEKQIYDLMKQNQVLRDRWDMMNDAIVRNQSQKEYNQAPIAAYERMLQEERGLSGASFYRNQPKLSSQQSYKTNVKPTSYNQFLKQSVKQEQVRSRKKKNLSMYHRSGRTDYVGN